jgi:hypothetical protein
MMNNEDIFKILVSWSILFEIDVVEMDQEDFPPDIKDARGFFNQSKQGPLGMRGRGGMIVFKTGLPLDEKLEILAHEIGHMTLALLGIEYQPLTHEPTVTLFTHSLLASLREDYNDPVLKIKICKSTELVKKFLGLVKEKQDSTFQGNLELHQAYDRLREKERELK